MCRGWRVAGLGQSGWAGHAPVQPPVQAHALIPHPVCVCRVCLRVCASNSDGRLHVDGGAPLPHHRLGFDSRWLADPRGDWSLSRTPSWVAPPAECMRDRARGVSLEDMLHARVEPRSGGGAGAVATRRAPALAARVIRSPPLGPAAVALMTPCAAPPSCAMLRRGNSKPRDALAYSTMSNRWTGPVVEGSLVSCLVARSRLACADTRGGHGCRDGAGAHRM